MSTLLLVRHGLTAKTGPVLTGRSPGVHLDERGVKQAVAVAERVAQQVSVASFARGAIPLVPVS